MPNGDRPVLEGLEVDGHAEGGAQLVLPAMRRQGGGRIVNIGSMGGVITTPMGGAYHATKFAVEAISDVLRAEVAPFGIDVVLVQPGGVRTNFMQTILRSIADTGPGSPYATEKSGFVRLMSLAERGPGMLRPSLRGSGSGCSS